MLFLWDLKCLYRIIGLQYILRGPERVPRSMIWSSELFEMLTYGPRVPGIIAELHPSGLLYFSYVCYRFGDLCHILSIFTFLTRPTAVAYKVAAGHMS